MIGQIWAERALTKHDLSLADTSLGSLAKKFGTTPQEIVTRNNVAWNSAAINAWVLRVGGREITPGNFALTVGNKIMLPTVPVIPDPAGEKPPVAAKIPPSPFVASQFLGIDMSWWVYGGLALGGFWLYRRGRKKSRAK